MVRTSTLAGSLPPSDSQPPGLRAARLKVIFELPAEYGRITHPLVYLEWYTPFHRVDPGTGLYQVSVSTRNRMPNSVILPANRVLGYCHLAGKCGAAIPVSWTSENVLDKASVFYVNPYISLNTFSVTGLYASSACLK